MFRLPLRSVSSRMVLREKHTLVLMRHGQSTWNMENKFTGWHDVPLSEKGVQEAEDAGVLLNKEGFKFDVAFTSFLRRAIITCDKALDATDSLWVPTTKAWQLNERHYGGLTGLDKKETVDKHGKDQVLVWRRSFDIPPPEVDTSSEYYPGNDRRYDSLTKDQIPLTESLKITAERVLPYWQNEIVPVIKEGNNILIAAHGNSLRALVMHLDNISEEEITGINIPTATPLVYELDDDMKPIPQPGAFSPLQGRYLGDQEAIRASIEGVKNQTK